MPAYVIAETHIADPEQYARYMAASPAAIAEGGGRFVARGGDVTVLEGDWRPPRLVVLEFEDADAAQRWYDSEQYRAVRSLREGAGHVNMVLVAGYEA
ncbi:MAG TPA: DUF1330 domain-containing protein [Gaiellaceae bacterium]|nr:DUF1330 domain-containing protein [Gaiellaceae bacterium]